MTKYELKIKTRKQEKYERDENDYKLGRVLTFARRFDAPRKDLQQQRAGNKQAAIRVDTTESEIDSEPGDNSASTLEGNVMTPFHEEFQLLRHSWLRGGKNKPPEQENEKRDLEVEGRKKV